MAIEPDRFEYGGVDLPIIDIYFNTSDGALYYCLNGSLSSYQNEGWSLYADGTVFAFSGSTLTETVDRDCYSWTNSGLSWSDGDSVSMSLGDPATIGDVDLPPNAPIALRVLPESGDPNGSLSVSWTDPDNTALPPITDYDVRYRVDGTNAWTEVTNTSITASPLVLPGLVAGSTYNVQIRAVNERGGGGWSDSGTGATGTAGNDPPYFVATEVPPMDVSEDAADSTAVGDPLVTTDPDAADNLTHALSGTGSSNFAIDSGGQITVASGATLDHETTPSYSLSVTVHYGKDADGNADTSVDDTISVTVTVTNVDEAPAVTGTTALDYAENGTVSVATYTASDPEGETGITWSLSGTDSGDFSISTNGVLIFGDSPNFESAADDNTDNAYLVTVEASDGTLTGDLAVTVRVTNVDEAGTIAFSSDQPQVGTELTATLSDPDGSETSVTWAWAKSTDWDGSTGTWTDIDSAVSASYTPVGADVGNYLRATASYTDPQGSGKSAEAVSGNPVQAAQAGPAKPTGLVAEPGNTEVKLSWQDPTDSTITKHQYQQKTGTDDFGTTWTDISDSAPSEAIAASYTVTSLTNGTEYTFRIRAVNAGGEGEASETASATPVPLPAAPTGLVAAARSEKVLLTWHALGDTTVTGWDYRIRKVEVGEASTWHDISGSDADTTSHTVENLEAGQKYSFSVRAVNASGNGPSVRPAVTATVQSVPEKTEFKPDLTIRTSTGIRVYWHARSPRTGFHLEYKNSTQTEWTRKDLEPGSNSLMTNTAAVMDLSPGTEYQFRVRAHNYDVNADWSDIYKVAPRARRRRR